MVKYTELSLIYFTLLCNFNVFEIVFPTKGKGGAYSLSYYISVAIKKRNRNNILSKRALLVHKESLTLMSIEYI